MNIIAAHCTRAIIVEGGRAKLFDDIEEGIDVYTWLRAA
jgi:capsular polysaccharide transport system ATP-binding protein